MYDVILQFNDGPTRYYEGERVAAENFAAADLEKYIGYGWLAEEGQSPSKASAGQTVTLTIHDGQLGHKSEY